MDQPRIPHPNPFCAWIEDSTIGKLSRRLAKLKSEIAEELGKPVAMELSEARKEAAKT